MNRFGELDAVREPNLIYVVFKNNRHKSSSKKEPAKLGGLVIKQF